MRNRLSGKKQLSVGLTLFSMFFGAESLIFPPFLGIQTGNRAWIAMTGFALSAIGFPVLGVVAVARSRGLDALARQVYPVFIFVFTLLAYLSTGPYLTIPGATSISFEMAVAPFVSRTVLGGTGGLGTAQLLCSAVFFLIALLLALKPDKPSNRLREILMPCLLTLIFLISVGCVLYPIGGYGSASRVYERNPMVEEFLKGYLTIDTIAALNLGIIIALSIQAMGMMREKAVVSATAKAGIIMGIVLMAMYNALAHIRAMTGGAFGVMGNGAQASNRVVQYQFGNVGAVILATISFIACLNTCVGLLSYYSRYFCTIVPRVGYRTWVFLFAGASLVISNAGLNRILEVSMPVLNMVYPVAIMLIVLAFLHPLIRRFRLVYPVCALFAEDISIGSKIPTLAGLMAELPFYGLELQWIVPAAVGGVLGVFLSSVWKGRGSGEHFPE